MTIRACAVRRSVSRAMGQSFDDSLLEGCWFRRRVSRDRFPVAGCSQGGIAEVLGTPVEAGHFSGASRRNSLSEGDLPPHLPDPLSDGLRSAGGDAGLLVRELQRRARLRGVAGDGRGLPG